MKAERILEKHATENMIEWNQKSFKKSHEKLYKSIMGAINEALQTSNDIEKIEDSCDIISHNSDLKMNGVCSRCGGKYFKAVNEL